MSVYTMSADDRVRERDRARADAEVQRAAMRDAYTHELRGLEGRLAGIAHEVGRVDEGLRNATPAWRTQLQAERDELLRVHENLEARIGLVNIERKRYEQ